MAEPMWLGRLDKIQLTDDDDVLISDVVGGRFKTSVIGARALHKKLGEFLAASNDAKPLTQPTRKEYSDLVKRVDELERKSNA